LTGAQIQWSRPPRSRIVMSLGLGTACCIGALLIVGTVYDVSAAVARAVNLDTRLLGVYQRALENNADWPALSEVIESSIVPELARERSELAHITRIRAPQRRLLENLQGYLRLKETVWQLRAEGFRKNRPDLLEESRQKDAQEAVVLRNLMRSGRR
jgi:hypothetical protein